jgi:hypothetical protein
MQLRHLFAILISTITASGVVEAGSIVLNQVG